MNDPPIYWFKAKRHGWGWGMPQTWQGWLADGAFVVGILATTLRCAPAAPCH